MKFLKIFLAIVLVSRISAELFSAIEELESLSFNEEKLIHEMKMLIQRLEGTIRTMKRFVKIEVRSAMQHSMLSVAW